MQTKNANSDHFPSANKKSTCQETKTAYNEWNPPSPSTLLSKIYNIRHNDIKYEMGSGVYSTTIKQIESYLNNKKYCCNTCSCYMDFGSFCTTKGCKVLVAKSICKSFEPKPELYRITKSNGIYRNEKNQNNTNIKEKKKRKNTRKEMSGELPRTNSNVLKPKFTPFDPYDSPDKSTK
jgi:hypothetical protein